MEFLRSLSIRTKLFLVSHDDTIGLGQGMIGQVATDGKQILFTDVPDNFPVIAVTACAMKCDDTKRMEAGASDHIPRPVDLKKFISTTAKWLQGL